MDIATFGAGCFWCVEAILKEIRGVGSVMPGFSGGETADPTYEDVCKGTTGHAEVCQFTFDPDKITFDELLEIFWSIHDPTTMNRQGGDEGTQYRSAIFYFDSEQKMAAERSKEAMQQSAIFDGPIVTEIMPLTDFYPAETNHKDYYSRNSTQPYCTTVITPKLAQFKRSFKEKLVKE